MVVQWRGGHSWGLLPLHSLGIPVGSHLGLFQESLPSAYFLEHSSGVFGKGEPSIIFGQIRAERPQGEKLFVPGCWADKWQSQEEKSRLQRVSIQAVFLPAWMEIQLDLTPEEMGETTVSRKTAQFGRYPVCQLRTLRPWANSFLNIGFLVHKNRHNNVSLKQETLRIKSDDM